MEAVLRRISSSNGELLFLALLAEFAEARDENRASVYIYRVNIIHIALQEAQ